MQIRKTMFASPMKLKGINRKKTNKTKQLSPSPEINPFACLSIIDAMSSVKSQSPRDSKLPKLRAISPSLRLLPPNQKRSKTNLFPNNFISLKLIPKNKSIITQPTRTPTFDESAE
jgi:hypothetical protein